MAPRHKDFGNSGVYRAENLEPLTFSLVDQTFRCHPMLPGYEFMTLVAAVGDGSGSVTVAAMLDFLEKAVLEEDWKKFTTLVTDPQVVVSSETIGLIVEYLVEQYSERPTTRPSTSLDGSQPTGQELPAGGSSSEAPTLADSTV